MNPPSRHSPLMISLAALALAALVFTFAMIRFVIAPPQQFAFISTSIYPHEVVAGGDLTMTAVADVYAAPECYSGAQRSLRFSDRSEARIPGTRTMLGTGTRRTIIYEMAVPDNAPSGPATLTVREIFTCGPREPVASPAIRFMIRGATEPGVDRFYDGRRDD